MSLEHWFRLFQYLSLGLSCAALVFAEAPFLPELRFCLAPMLVLLLLAWRVEGRWSLPNWGANLLGMLIAAGGIFWLVTQLSDDEFVLANLPLHLALLPYMGPLSMAALLVKVFRLRDANHFWHLQGLGLLQIGLGCLLDGGPAFGAMMMAYLAGDLICLSLHYRISARDAMRGYQGCHGERVVETSTSPFSRVRGSDMRSSPLTGRGLLAFTLRWTLLISATALLPFLLMPRGDDWNWGPLNKYRPGYSRGRHQGVNAEMNLNNIGRVELDDKVALHVTAVDAADRPKLDLPANQRWRGSVLDWYEHGSWTTMHLMPVRQRSGSQLELPDFDGEQFFLTFTVEPRQAGGLVLAEPIRFGRARSRLPVIPLSREDRRRMFVEVSGTVLSQVNSDRRREYRYRQVVPGRGDRGKIIAEKLLPRRDIPLLLHLPYSLRTRLRDWTVDLLRRLSQGPRYHLPEAVRGALAQSHNAFWVKEKDWEAVARLLTDYLAHSGEYTYTLEITRHNRSLDPVLDFLMNVKKGHCERYAAALALMLRSIGIPARVIKGFRGCDSQGEGHYVVRHSHAHAWVEILVPHPRTAPRPNAWPRSRFSPYYDWLTLDATPPEPPLPEHHFSLTYLWEEAERFCVQWWRALIVEYDSEEQADLWETLMEGRLLWRLLKVGLAALAFGAALAVWLFLRRLPRPRSGASAVRGDNMSLYSRLVQILTRYVPLQPHLAQTPREYGLAAHALLQSRPTFAALADFPTRIVELFYRSRFGSRPLNEGERQQIEAELNRLAEELRPFSRGTQGSATSPHLPADRS